MLGILVFFIGLVLFFLVSTIAGILVMLLGIALVFIPGVPYGGYSTWRGRRGPPP